MPAHLSYSGKVARHEADTPKKIIGEVHTTSAENHRQVFLDRKGVRTYSPALGDSTQQRFVRGD